MRDSAFVWAKRGTMPESITDRPAPVPVDAVYEVARGLLLKAYAGPTYGGQVYVDAATGRISLSLDAASRLLDRLNAD